MRTSFLAWSIRLALLLVSSSVAFAQPVTISWTPFPLPCPDVGVNALARWTLSADVELQGDRSVLLKGLHLAFSSAAMQLGSVTVSGSLVVREQRIGLEGAWFPVMSTGRDVALYPRSPDGMGARDAILPIRLGADESLLVRGGAVLRPAGGGVCSLRNLKRTLTVQDFLEALP